MYKDYFYQHTYTVPVHFTNIFIAYRLSVDKPKYVEDVANMAETSHNNDGCLNNSRHSC